MEPDKKPDETPASEPSSSSQQAPSDALSRTPDDLEQDGVGVEPEKPAEKKVSPIKKLWRAVNVYFLSFVLLIAVAGAITVVNYLNSKKAETPSSIANKELTAEDLKDLATTDVSVGDSAQTLNIQGSAIISGQTLMRGDLNVAGNFQTGGSVTTPNITVAGTSNLGTAQINTLQVATNTAIQGSTTMRDLNVAGSASFSGPITASQITVTRLVMSGNAVLEIPNHISFTGPPPRRDINAAVLGSGGTAQVAGSDTSGTITIHTGNNPTPGCFATINFAVKFSIIPRVIVSPVNEGAGQTQYYVTRTASGFSICTVNAAPARASFAYDYFIAS